MDLPLAVNIEPNAFHIIGSLFAIWAVFVGYMGSRRGFPETERAERLVIVVSLALMLGAIGSAIVTGKTEEHEGGHEGAEHAPPAPHYP